VSKRKAKPCPKSLGQSHIFHPPRHCGGKELRRLRHQFNVQNGLNAVKDFCRENGVTLNIKNNGHHWQFIRDGRKKKDKQVADWWPAGARLVMNKKYDQGIYAIDYELVIGYLWEQWVGEKHRDKSSHFVRRVILGQDPDDMPVWML